jgi:hypothetical protein
MKTLFTSIALLTFCMAEGQYFQQRFNLDYAVPSLRNERCNSGIRTRDNYMAGNPALHYYAGIGTSYNNAALPAPNNVADRMRFQQLNNTGVTVMSNLGYQFADATTAPWYHSYGNSIAEVNNATHNGGYVTVGSVANNTITGAAAIAGGTDALFTQLDAGGAVISSVRYDILGGADQAWCIRKSATVVNGRATWILCGQSKRAANNTDCFVARVFSDGTPVWFNRYNFDPGGAPFNSAHNIAKQLCEDAFGYIYVVGTLQDGFAGAGIDGLAFKLTSGGVVVWGNDYNISPDDEFHAVRLTADGNIIVGGFTTFAIVAPATSNMLITKLTAAAGAIMFQNVLRVSSAGNFYTSKCYDIIETAGPQYFLAGPATRNGITYEMMYKTNAAGFGINWYRYNRMNYNVGFGLDNVNTAANAGVVYFASMQNPANVAFSDSHIMKTDYFGRTCNFCAAYPPNNAPLQMEVHPRNRLQQPTAQTKKLVSAVFKYSNILICNQAVIICGAAVAATSAEAATTVEKTGVAKLFPNPVINVLHVQFNTLPAGEYNLSLTDINGKTILQRNNVHNNGKSSADIDMSSFAPGIYMLTIKKDDVRVEQKVIKQ